MINSDSDILMRKKNIGKLQCINDLAKYIISSLETSKI